MSRAKTAVRTLAIAAGIVIAAPAFAQDATRPTRTVTTVPPKTPAATEATAREEAAKSMPTYEAFGEGTAETSLSETFYRLARDFAPTEELSVDRLGSVPVWPRGEFKIGNVRILPFLREAVEYDSNYYEKHRTGTYGSPNANDAAFTHVNEVGLLADTAMAGGRLKLAASVDATWDIRYDDGNKDRGTNGSVYYDDQKDDAFEFEGDFVAAYRFPSGVYVRGGVGFEKSSDPIDVEYTGEFQRDTWQTFLTWGMDRDILFGSKFKFEMGMNMRDVAGDDNNLDDLDRTETEYYLKASYPFLRDTTRLFGLLRYREDVRKSNRINDGYVWGFDAGMEGSIPISGGEYRGLRGQVSVGFDSSLYGDDTFESGSSEYYRDENRRNTSLNVNALLQYIMSRKTTIDFRYLRANEFSFHGNYEIIDRFDLTATHAVTPRMMVRLGTYFEYDDPSGRLSQQEVGASDTTGEYPNSTSFGAGAGLRYALNEWLDLDFDYEWERRNNRVTGFVNHSASLGLTLYLNAIKPKVRTSAPQ